MNLKNSNCDKTQTQIVTKLNNSNCVKNSISDETQIVMKFKNSNYDETQKLKWSQNSKNSNCDKA